MSLQGRAGAGAVGNGRNEGWTRRFRLFGRSSSMRSEQEIENALHTQVSRDAQIITGILQTIVQQNAAVQNTEASSNHVLEQALSALQQINAAAAFQMQDRQAAEENRQAAAADRQAAAADRQAAADDRQAAAVDLQRATELARQVEEGQANPRPQNMGPAVRRRPTLIRCIVALAATLLFVGAYFHLWLYRSHSTLGLFIWNGDEDHTRFGFIVVGAIYTLLLLRALFRMIPCPRIARVIIQTFLVLGSRYLGAHVTDMASLLPTSLLALFTMPLCLLLGIPDDFSFYLSFLSIASSGILEHFDIRSFLAWTYAGLYTGGMLLGRLAATHYVVDRFGVVQAIALY